ncbi:hypothetical protein CASFOL_019559 [Castilleja foliolosa]|uniref:Uncharacterized protein n=1 Tax=Castilleja foliolosa TaxID=1961234 RepID=A0ABD3D4P1_9LAMI
MKKKKRKIKFYLETMVGKLETRRGRRGQTSRAIEMAPRKRNSAVSTKKLRLRIGGMKIMNGAAVQATVTNSCSIEI